MSIRLIALALVVIAIEGCTNKMPNNPDERNYQGKVKDLVINALDHETVSLRWTNPEAIYECFRVSWSPLNGVIVQAEDVGSIVVGNCETRRDTLMTTISLLRPTMYRFIVRPISLSSDHTYKPHDIIYADTNDGAPAVHHASDGARPGERLRLYEFGSSEGDVLYLDPSGGGPTRLDLATAPASTLQFVLLTEWPELRSGYFRIAAAHTTAYNATGKCDPHVAIGGFQSFYSLANWYVYTYDGVAFNDWSEDQHRIPNPQAGRTNSGYFVRIGDPAGGSFRYVRFSIVGESDGTLLRGEAPNRYIELEVSIGYPGVPFA